MLFFQSDQLTNVFPILPITLVLYLLFGCNHSLYSFLSLLFFPSLSLSHTHTHTHSLRQIRRQSYNPILSLPLKKEKLVIKSLTARYLKIDYNDTVCSII